MLLTIVLCYLFYFSFLVLKSECFNNDVYFNMGFDLYLLKFVEEGIHYIWMYLNEAGIEGIVHYEKHISS